MIKYACKPWRELTNAKRYTKIFSSTLAQKLVNHQISQNRLQKLRFCFQGNFFFYFTETIFYMIHQNSLYTQVLYKEYDLLKLLQTYLSKHLYFKNGQVTNR